MTNNYIDLKDYRLFFVEKVGELKKYQVAPLNDVDNKEFLTGLFNSMYDELPVPKPKKKK